MHVPRAMAGQSHPNSFGDIVVGEISRITRRNRVRPRSSTRSALRVRTNLQARNPAKTKQHFGSKTIRDVRFRGRVMRVARYF